MSTSSKLKPFGEILGLTFQAYGMRDQELCFKLMKHWPSIIGERIAQKTRPITLNKNVLTLGTESSVWQQELIFLKEEIINKINTFLFQDAVQDIRIISIAEFTERNKKPETKAPLPKTLTKEEEHLLKTFSACISDPEIKEAFERAFLAHLRNQPTNP